jgi:hypothetical protein
MNIDPKDVIAAMELQLTSANRDAATLSAMCEGLKRRVAELEAEKSSKRKS